MGKTAEAPKVKREKKVRAKGEPVAPIKWFAEQATETQDAEKIRSVATKKDYSQSTISIQLGRLRALGLIPPLVKSDNGEAKKNTKSKVKASKPKASGTFRPQPKPGQGTGVA